LRYTPAGLPALDLSLKHESTVTQDGQARKVSMEIKARAIGVEITKRVAALEMGSEHGFAGFLGSQRNGRGVVFHVTELD
jgi:primosomal replication protein N